MTNIGQTMSGQVGLHSDDKVKDILQKRDSVTFSDLKTEIANDKRRVPLDENHTLMKMFPKEENREEAELVRIGLMDSERSMTP